MVIFAGMEGHGPVLFLLWFEYCKVRKESNYPMLLYHICIITR